MGAFWAFLTLFPTAYFFCGSHGGGGSHPPHGKSTLDWLSPILFYTVTYTYIDSLNPRGQVSIFKTLEMRSTQSSATNLMNASKIWQLCNWNLRFLKLMMICCNQSKEEEMEKIERCCCLKCCTISKLSQGCGGPASTNLPEEFRQTLY